MCVFVCVCASVHRGFVLLVSMQPSLDQTELERGTAAGCYSSSCGHSLIIINLKIPLHPGGSDMLISAFVPGVNIYFCLLSLHVNLHDSLLLSSTAFFYCTICKQD